MSARRWLLAAITIAAAVEAIASGCGPTSSCPSVALDASQVTDEPIIAVGYDAYRQWDRWAYLRLGMRAHMASTYDRAGGNEGGDASHYLRLESDRAVALDVAGPGILYFARANQWHGSPWHYDVDGQDNVVSAADTPPATDAGSALLPNASFPAPLNLTWPATQGSDLLATAIPFTQSMSLGHERTHYGTGYFVYDTFPLAAPNLSQPIATWNESSAPPADVLALLGQAGQDIAPQTNVTNLGGMVTLAAGMPVTIFDATGPAVVRALQITVPVADAMSLDDAHLRITWDARSMPSVDAPVSLFFGAGTLYNRTNAEWLVQALPVSAHFVGGNVTLSVYFPMPFFRSAHVELVGGTTAIASVAWQARTQPYADPTNWAGYFHATYVDQGTTPTQGQDLVLLDTTKAEGGGDWCGHLVGTSFIFTDQATLPALTTLEGDPRFFFDDSQTPQVQGTGTEEWGGGGTYWFGGIDTTLPLYGHPVGAVAGMAVNASDMIESAYRFLLADAMPFGKNARVQLEHGGCDDSTEHYRTLADWYGLPGACLVQTDSVHISDPTDEAAHGYVSPDASGVDTVTSRYELGIDHMTPIPTTMDPCTGPVEVYPATTDTGRHTTGTSELSLAIDPANRGVLLRRKLDYAFPDQRAEVFVAPDDGADECTAFTDAGTWYTAGSTTGVYSNPNGELDPFTPVVQVSNRQWRDDEFLLPRQLTAGHGRIRVRFVFSPSNLPLTPATPLAPQAWSEYRYTAYVWTLPPAP